MNRTIFLAGAAGAIGSRVAPLLVADGWRVVGTTRAHSKVAALQARGIEVAVVDVFDAEALTAAVVAAQPTVVMHQLTDLPAGLDPARMAEATARNARIREEGTRNLVAASSAARARRLIAQSVAFAYADGPLPHREEDALAVDAEGRAGVSARGVASLEAQVAAAPCEGIVLRYGRLYGPGTGSGAAQGAAPLHVDAAARAAVLAVRIGAPGIYNLTEDDGTVSSDKAKRTWGWSANWRAGQ
ncbi:NAD-dependent epimerase/dehydratase family protein [Rhodopseudomonas boonkerdii]|uniref:NAD-dependent epimerase/dehydratase family protein n=1 Tax=Rhodopseudomonas boonkerdii TaxID=475937 RepID=UPI001E58CCC0|nr:NAD-dependent epimerase/dehydratase family protein [Rhodopseudomonas boonkerdii]UGV28477.1 NAD-dependent epimerase/dehydratase family protein [Rhodopseudomonas boonkerdii]